MSTTEAQRRKKELGKQVQKKEKETHCVTKQQRRERTQNYNGKTKRTQKQCNQQALAAKNAMPNLWKEDCYFALTPFQPRCRLTLQDDDAQRHHHYIRGQNKRQIKQKEK